MPPALTWADRLYAWRDRLFRDARFQRWIATSPLTRAKAGRETRAAFDLCAGFVYSQILAACIELKVLHHLSEQPATAMDLAARASLPVASMETLLSAAAALGLVHRRRHDRWGLAAKGAAIIGSPGLAAMISHHAHLYADLRDPVALLRGTNGPTELARYWPYAGIENPASLQADAVATYSDLMAESQAMLSTDILAAYPFKGHRQLLDVGGGQGAFVSAVAADVPQLRLSLFDLPAVTERARDRFAAAGLSERVTVHGGDFFRDELPVGADIISLVRIVHDHGDDAVRKLLRSIYLALPRGGTILIAEPLSATPGAESVGDAYFAFYLLAMGSGRPRTAREIQAMLTEAGFVRPRILPTARPLVTGLLTAVK